MIPLLQRALAFVEANPDLDIFAVDAVTHSGGHVRIQVPPEKLRETGRAFTAKPVPGMPRCWTLEAKIGEGIVLVASEERAA